MSALGPVPGDEQPLELRIYEYFHSELFYIV